MPNHCTNNVTITGPQAVLAQIANDLKGTGIDGDVPYEVALDFNKVIPQPAELNVVAGSEGEMGYFALTGKNPTMSFGGGWLTYPWVKELGITTVEQFRAWVEKERPKALEAGRQYAANIEKFGVPTWYEWRCDKWGTKWNAYDIDGPTLTARNLKYRFDTAWSPPSPVLEALAQKYPGITVRNRWREEGGDRGDDSFGPYEPEEQAA